MKFQKTLVTFSMGVLSVVLAGIALCSLVPTAGAKDLKAQAEIVQFRMTQSLAASGLKLHILVTRDNLVSAALAESGIFHASHGTGDSANANERVTDSFLRGLDSVDSAQSIDPRLTGSCDIYVSAQAMQQEGPIRKLSESLGSQALAWRFVLAHEVAHCLRNSRLSFHSAQASDQPASASMMQGPDLIELSAADYLAEAYADAFSVGDFWYQDPVRAAGVAQTIAGWRASTMLGPAWKTSDAISLMARRLNESANEGGKESTSASGKAGIFAFADRRLDDMAWQAARDTLPGHLQAMGLPACQAIATKLSCPQSHP